MLLFSMTLNKRQHEIAGNTENLVGAVVLQRGEQSMGKRGHRSVPDKTFLHDRPHSVILQALAIPVLSGASFVHGG